MDTRLKVLPSEFLERLKRIFPPGVLPQVLKGYLEPKPTTIRVNQIKTTDDKIIQFFQRAKIKLVPEKSVPHCFYIQGLSDKKLKELPCYHNGEIYLQNLSSQLPPMSLNVKPGQEVLDLCASPGSKTTQLASLMKNQGVIIALEPDHIRFMRLNKNLTHQGCDIVESHQRRAEGFCRQALEEKRFFDKILCDVPCSGDGTFYVNQKSSYQHWDMKQVLNQAKLQKKILSKAVQILKPQGQLLYSTCSISPEENEEVLDSVLKQSPHLTLLDLKKVFPLSFWKPPLKSFANKEFAEVIQKATRVYPSDKTEGFFCALIQRVS